MGTPVYHGMVSSALKNAFDYLGKDEFAGKTVGLPATAGGGSYAPTLEHPANRRSDGPRLDTPHEVGIRGASSAFDADGEFVDPTWRPASRKLGRMATEYALIEPQRV